MIFEDLNAQILFSQSVLLMNQVLLAYILPNLTHDIVTVRSKPFKPKKKKSQTLFFLDLSFRNKLQTFR